MKNENMDTQEIKRLIELYFECGTDVRQERMLRDYFSSGHADGELKRYEALFSRSDYDEAAVPGDDFDMKILEMIQRPQVTENAKRPAGRTMKFVRIVSMAACLAILVTVGIKRDNVNPEECMLCADTFSNPHEALNEIESVFSMMASRMQDGGEMIRHGAGLTEPVMDVFNIPGYNDRQCNRNI